MRLTGRATAQAMVALTAATLVAGCSGAATTATTAAAPAPADVTAAAPAPSVAGSPSPATTARPVTTSTPRPTAKPASTAKPAAKPAAKPSASTAPRRPQPPVRPSTKPKPRPSSPPAPATGGMSNAEAEVLRLVNAERAKAGCGALRSNGILLAVARAHSRDMGVKRYFDHTSQDGRSPFDRMRAAGYRGGLMGENIAAGQPTAAAVMKSWMNSPGHKANILNCGYKVIGIGVATVASSPFRIYWTQDFGDR